MPFNRKPCFARLLICSALTASASLAIAADSGPPVRYDRIDKIDRLAAVRQHIASKHWSGAIDELKRIGDGASADWNNLMGYAMRKQTTPDLDAAERFYDAALRIDPAHRGALEYSGELALQKGDLASAQRRLAALDKACLLPCREYTDLKKAVEQYRAGDLSIPQKHY